MNAELAEVVKDGIVSRRFYETSPTIGKIAAALAKAQGAMKSATKTSLNPFFHSQYADLSEVWDACRGPMSDNELAVFQPVSTSGKLIVVVTMLAHSSGEWVSSTLTLTPKDSGPQAAGACITYGRRYGLSSMVGIAQADDDGESAEGRGSGRTPVAPKPQRHVFTPPPAPDHVTAPLCDPEVLTGTGGIAAPKNDHLAPANDASSQGRKRIAAASNLGELAKVAMWIKTLDKATRAGCRDAYLARKAELGGSGKNPEGAVA